MVGEGAGNRRVPPGVARTGLPFPTVHLTVPRAGPAPSQFIEGGGHLGLQRPGASCIQVGRLEIVDHKRVLHPAQATDPYTAPMAEAVARYYFKLMAYMDEYEVARLYSDGSFRRQLEGEFEGDYRVQLHLSPQLFFRRDPETGRVGKITVGPWALRAFGLLAKLRFLRGTPLDPFGRTAHRRLERDLIGEYEATLETLGVRTLERARLNAALHFYRLLLSARTVTITWPENEGDRPVVPSPFLAELTPLTKAGLVNRGIETVSGIQFSFRIEESRSIPELAKAISLAGTPAGIEELLSSERGGLAAVKAACIFNPPEPATAVSAPRDREFRVTELDLYIQCPYDYYVKRVLDIEPQCIH